MKSVHTELAKSKYVEVSELGSRYNLSFSSQLVLGNMIMALDGVKRRLLVVEIAKEENHPLIIDLNNVAAVTVRKNYGSIGQGELKSKGLEAFLKRIDLQFKLNDNAGTIVLPFYDREINDVKDRARLGKSAKNWQMLLSKMVSPETGKKIES